MEHSHATQFIRDLLQIMLDQKGSDLFITANFPPAVKIDGELTPISNQALTAHQTSALVHAVMNDIQIVAFDTSKEANFAIHFAGLGRFRVSAFMQQGNVGMVIRIIATTILSTDDLGLPPILKEIVMEKRGLILMVGATSSGKSTTLAALLDHRNQHSHGHIITIEDPIEFIHPHKNCIVTQREIGVDTENWESALNNALRQAPDVIQIGEIRDKTTMDHAICFAETGHLCLATLHANSSNQALDRIVNFFPEERRQQLLMDLSLNLKAMIGQRLIPLRHSQGRCLAMEIMLNSPYLSDLIFKGKIHEIKELMKKSREVGMQTFDQALFDLYQADKISYEDALRNADSVNDLRLAIKLQGKGAPDQGSSNRAEHLGIL